MYYTAGYYTVYMTSSNLTVTRYMLTTSALHAYTGPTCHHNKSAIDYSNSEDLTYLPSSTTAVESPSTTALSSTPTASFGVYRD